MARKGHQRENDAGECSCSCLLGFAAFIAVILLFVFNVRLYTKTNELENKVVALTYEAGELRSRYYGAMEGL